MFVYLVRCNEYSKIGIATNLVSRVIGLQCGNPYNLYLHDAYSFDNGAHYTESSLHAIFEEKSKRGEWFQLDAEDFDKFKDFCMSKGGTPARDDYYKSLKISYEDRVIISDSTTDRANVLKLLNLCHKYNKIRKIKDVGVIYSAAYLKVNQDWHKSIVDVLVKHELVKIGKDGSIRICNRKKVDTLIGRIASGEIIIHRRGYHA
jgi:hypothetical protein